VADLHADENVPPELVEELRRRGHDVLTTQDVGRHNRGIADPDVLSFAVAYHRAVLTGNRRHFIRLHRQSNRHAGIVAYTDDRDVAILAARIDAALRDHAPLAGKLIRVCKPPVGTTIEE
jgi:hypothetical protein